MYQHREDYLAYCRGVNSHDLTWINQKNNSLDRKLHFIGCPDAGRGELAGLPVSFQNIKKA